LIQPFCAQLFANAGPGRGLFTGALNARGHADALQGLRGLVNEAAESAAVLDVGGRGERLPAALDLLKQSPATQPQAPPCVSPNPAVILHRNS